MEEKLYSVSEAVRLIGVESHVLRYWEEELQIAIRRTHQGHRVYTAENIETFRQVREWKEKGIQLKAIRVLLEKTEYSEEEGMLRAQVEEVERRMLETDHTREDAKKYAIVMNESEPDNLKQFEVILKKMIAEVVEEQNEKLEQAISEMLKNELEELYLQYYQGAIAEAAAAKEKKGGIWKRFRKKRRCHDRLCV